MLLLKAFAHLPLCARQCVGINDEDWACPYVPHSPMEKDMGTTCQKVSSAWYEVLQSKGGRAKPLGVK